MCRGCLFVKVDVPSGGDIDGCCLKQGVIDEFKGEIRKPNLLRSRFQGVSEAKAMPVLSHRWGHILLFMDNGARRSKRIRFCSCKLNLTFPSFFMVYCLVEC